MILDEIIASTRFRVEEAKHRIPMEQMMNQVAVMVEKNPPYSRNELPFETALRVPGISFICEVKKASPSKGIISPDFPYLDIAKEYERGGAGAISVLTEPNYFLGKDSYLQEIRREVTVPILRKDFTIDPYQIYEAKLLGADAVLLICAVLEDELLKEYITLGNQLGLSPLVETHTADEIKRAIAAGARIIGMNNRNLKTFEINPNLAIGLRNLVPKDILYIAESGITDSKDIKRLEMAGVDGVLIGETLMRFKNREEGLVALKGGTWNKLR